MPLAAAVLATPPEAAMRLRLPVTDPEIGWVFVALVILGGALGVLWVRFKT